MSAAMSNPMLHFVGTSFAPTHLKAAAIKKGLFVTDSIKDAAVVFISEDTPVVDGRRDIEKIRKLCYSVQPFTGQALVITSQVPPGFTRSFGWQNISVYHLAETLRIKDAEERADNPEQFIIGCQRPQDPLPPAFLYYLNAFKCPIHKVTWEEAEFSKMAINLTLASQVDNANRLSKAAKSVGADWNKIIPILQHDRRIGPYSYLTPGRWQDSQHLLRDAVTLEEIETLWNIE